MNSDSHSGVNQTAYVQNPIPIPTRAIQHRQPHSQSRCPHSHVRSKRPLICPKWHHPFISHSMIDRMCNTTLLPSLLTSPKSLKRITKLTPKTKFADLTSKHTQVPNLNCKFNIDKWNSNQWVCLHTFGLLPIAKWGIQHMKTRNTRVWINKYEKWKDKEMKRHIQSSNFLGEKFVVIGTKRIVISSAGLAASPTATASASLLLFGAMPHL